MRAAFFDLDGTLVDSFEGVAKCIAHAFSAVDHAPPDDIRPWLGAPLRTNFVRHFGNQDLAERALHAFRVRYADVGVLEAEVCAGVAPMLEALVGDGVQLFVATSKPRVYANRLVEHTGLAHFFREVFGPELTGALENKTELLAHALATTLAPPHRASMIGDRHHDIEAAHANGVESIGVTWGFGTLEELDAAGAGAICATPAEVVDSVLAACARSVRAR
jgi:phosphoglycolate phosphatase